MFAAASVAAAAAFVALAFVTSRRFEPALLATLRILPLDWLPLSFEFRASVLESSWPPRAAFGGMVKRWLLCSKLVQRKNSSAVCSKLWPLTS